MRGPDDLRACRNYSSVGSGFPAGFAVDQRAGGVVGPGDDRGLTDLGRAFLEPWPILPPSPAQSALGVRPGPPQPQGCLRSS